MSLEKLRTISKDIILYAVRAADYEPLGFDSDALAGVRGEYFRSNGAPQEKKSEFSVQGVPHSLSCSMQSGSSLAWKVTVGSRTAETVRRSADGSYCVLTYGENGVIFKRQYFDSAHHWLRTEYYDRALQDRIVANLYPHWADGVLQLSLQEFSGGGIQMRELLPSAEEPAEGCAAAVSSNHGMLWYCEKKRSGERAAAPKRTELPDGFRFIKEAFTGAEPEDVLGLQNAAYLGEEDTVQTEPPAPPQEPEERPYSAYDTIEKILFEAQKTNKNIFGELALQDFGDDEPEPITPVALTEAPEPPAPVALTEAPEPPAPVALTEAPVPEPPAAQEASEPVTREAVQAAAEPAPAALLPAQSGSYAYYGALDENNRRTGRGRTVTPDGVTSYDGFYRGDKREGFGVCYYKEGSPNYIGDWSDGKRSGRGVGYRRSDGTLHAGKWRDNKPEGIGARFDADGNFLDVCTYVDGKRSGKSVSFDADGNLVVTLWRDGEAVSEKVISD